MFVEQPSTTLWNQEPLQRSTNPSLKKESRILSTYCRQNLDVDYLRVCKLRINKRGWNDNQLEMDYDRCNNKTASNKSWILTKPIDWQPVDMNEIQLRWIVIDLGLMYDSDAYDAWQDDDDDVRTLISKQLLLIAWALLAFHRLVVNTTASLHASLRNCNLLLSTATWTRTGQGRKHLLRKNPSGIVSAPRVIAENRVRLSTKAANGTMMFINPFHLTRREYNEQNKAMEHRINQRSNNINNENGSCQRIISTTTYQ